MKHRLFTTYLALQLRIARRRAVAMLAMAAAALLLGAAVAAAGQLTFSGQNFGGMQIAVASEEENTTIDMMVDVLAGMPDVSSFASIHKTTPQQARQMVQTGQASAAVVLPAGFLQSVMSGENLSPTLIVDSSRPLEMMLVAKLAESATRMLTRAQQGISFTLAVYDASGVSSPEKSAVVRDVNLGYATWVLGRGGMFRQQTVNPAGALNVTQFYLLSAIMYFAALSLPVLYRLYSFSLQKNWLRRLRAGGGSFAFWALAQLLAGAVALFLTLAVLLVGIALLGGATPSPAVLPGALLCALCLSCLGFLCCNTGSTLTAAGFGFVLFTAMLLTYGGAIPLVLLPGPIAALASFSPMGWMHGVLAPVFGAPFSGTALLYLGLFTVCLVFACLWYAHSRKRGRTA